jgi:hypothetical protein
MTCRFPIHRSTSCTPTRCCSTSMIQSQPSAKCVACACRAVWSPHGDADYAAMIWYPDSQALTRWLRLYHQVACSGGGQPDAGRRLLSWAHAAGLSEVWASATAWCFATSADVAWWSQTWAERLTLSDFGTQAIERGFSDSAELAQLAEGWLRWGRHRDAWFSVLHGEIVCRR